MSPLAVGETRMNKRGMEIGMPASNNYNRRYLETIEAGRDQIQMKR
jgi:hypothetical protein